MQYASHHPNCNVPKPMVHVHKLLCYADDAFVFVKDLPDLARLNCHLDVYWQVTNNANINYNKVDAIPLPLDKTHGFTEEHVLPTCTSQNSRLKWLQIQ